MEKRTLLAIVLSALVWIIWFMVFEPDIQKEEPVKPAKTEDVRDVEKAEKPPETERVRKPVATDDAFIVESSGLTEEEIYMETDTYEFVFTNKGAAVKSVKFPERDAQLAVENHPYTAESKFGFNIHFNDREFMRGNSLDSELWAHRVENGRIIFHTQIYFGDTPVRIEKRFNLNNDGRVFEVEYSLYNAGRNPFMPGDGNVVISPAEMLGPELDYDNTFNRIRGIYYLDGKFRKANKGGGFFSSPGALMQDEGPTEWAGLISRYFLLIMIPQNFTGEGSAFDNREHSGFRTGIYSPIETIAPGESRDLSFKVYLGERDKDLLGEVDSRIVRAADYSTWIEPIRNFVLWALLGINSYVGNLGWALVIFSIMTKIVFMPLTKKSTESMKKMQELNPQMTKLREKYKDKPEVLQKEMMNLYKENKVNPLGGCLPILLQMPFFFALYSALINSIDLWQAPFVLWITDLSMPDTIFMIGDFNVNILPLVMSASMFFMQRMTTVDTGSGPQKMIMMMMPVLLIFIFWRMPSGLVLYWTLQNLFQVAHQLVVNKFSKKKS